MRCCALKAQYGQWYVSSCNWLLQESWNWGQDWHDELNGIYKKRREKVFELLRLLHCEFDTTQAGMFVWASVPDGFKDGYEVSDKVLHNANVFITPGGIFGSAGNHYVRVSLCTKEEKFDEAIARIKTQLN
ncbi:MAG: aminotransferase class I/II-fold pyridoxal phosphate-dependent enzyme [Ferruginibacter sp.]